MRNVDKRKKFIEAFGKEKFLELAKTDERYKKLLSIINRGNKSFTVNSYNNKLSLNLPSLSLISKLGDFPMAEYLYISYNDSHKETKIEVNRNNPHDNIINTSELNKSLSNIVTNQSHNQEEEDNEDVSLST